MISPYPSYLSGFPDDPSDDPAGIDQKASGPDADTLAEHALHTVMLMSHDIRGSLVSIGAGLKLLNKGSYGEMDKRAGRKVEELFARVEKLLGMAEEYLGSAASLMHEVEFEQGIVDLEQDILEPVLDELAFDLYENGIEMDGLTHFHTMGPLPVRANKIWLKAVVRNLLRNAIKYGGPRSRIEIGIRKEPSCYRVNVFNTGRSVPPEWRDKLFSGFTVCSNGDEKTQGGIGIGLRMIRDIIRKHGGQIWYEPTADGSNFVFTLPS